jgi:large subunit ribosomal protein L44e
MKVSKQMNVYCPKCKKHSPHAVSIYKKGKERALAAGTRKHEREKHGYGGQKWPELVRKVKTTKKQLLKLKCKECGCIVSRLGNRISKLQVE